ncbi:hypothetical protein IJ670_04890 [bacterium]|nr:hypothetical protein [bacterium]
MAQENYSINSSFGRNVMPQSANTSSKEQGTNLFEKTAEILDSITGFVDKYENVFNGDVQNEINLISRQAMLIGMSLKAGDTTVRNFDMNM